MAPPFHTASRSATAARAHSSLINVRQQWIFPQFLGHLRGQLADRLDDVVCLPRFDCFVAGHQLDRWEWQHFAFGIPGRQLPRSFESRLEVTGHEPGPRGFELAEFARVLTGPYHFEPDFVQDGHQVIKGIRGDRRSRGGWRFGLVRS